MENTETAFFLDYERITHHKSMMNDRVRIEQYRKAIEEIVKPGDIVVDMGAGTGILSFIAAKSGAKTVYAIERTDMIHIAEKIAADNAIENIVFIQQDSSEVKLPEKCDVLLSECLGYLVVQENMVTDFLEFRDKWLKPDGHVIPIDAQLYFAPVESEQAYESVSFWNTIYEQQGFNYSALLQVAANSPSQEDLAKGHFLAPPEKKHRFDFACDTNAAFQSEINFRITKNGLLHGIGGYFTSSLSPSIVLDTSPETKTHWRQHFFPLNQPVKVSEGDVVYFSVEVLLQKAMVDWLWIVEINGKNSEKHDTRRGIRLIE